MSHAIFILGLIYFVAHLFTAIFEKTKVPDVLLLILIGLVAGPFLGLIRPEDFGIAGEVMTTIALIVILFESGISLELNSLRSAFVPTIVLTLATFVFTLVLFALGGMIFLGLSKQLALCLGAILACSSAAVVIPLVSSLQIREPGATVLILESAISDVLSIVLTLGFVEAALHGESSPLKLTASILLSLSVSAVIGLIGGGVWIMILTRLRQFPNTMFTTIAFLFLLYGINELMSFSGAITALTFGVALVNYRRLGVIRWTRMSRLKPASIVGINDFEKGLYRELVFIFKTFFFIYLGLSIPFEQPFLLVLAAALSVILYSARFLLVRFFGPKQSSARDSSMMSLLIPKGLASAVLAGLPSQMGVEGGEEIKSFVYMTVLVTILFTAVLIPLFSTTKLGSLAERLASRRPREDDSEPLPAHPGLGMAMSEEPSAEDEEQTRTEALES